MKMTDLKKIKRTVQDISNAPKVDVTAEASDLAKKFDKVRQGLSEIVLGSAGVYFFPEIARFLADDNKYARWLAIGTSIALGIKGVYSILTGAEQLRDSALNYAIENKLNSLREEQK